MLSRLTMQKRSSMCEKEGLPVSKGGDDQAP